jgi:hypothetical protein
MPDTEKIKQKQGMKYVFHKRNRMCKRTEWTYLELYHLDLLSKHPPTISTTTSPIIYL